MSVHDASRIGIDDSKVMLQIVASLVTAVGIPKKLKIYLLGK